MLLFILRKIAETAGSAKEAADQLEAVVNKKAGLLGVSGLSNDMRVLRAAVVAGNEKARLAVDKFTWTIVKSIGSYFAELGGLDMLVFTGGIGENDIARHAKKFVRDLARSASCLIRRAITLAARRSFQPKIRR